LTDEVEWLRADEEALAYVVPADTPVKNRKLSDDRVVSRHHNDVIWISPDKVDYIDIYRPARLDPEVPIEDTIGAIADLVQAGYVRAIGLSEVGPETIRRANAVLWKGLSRETLPRRADHRTLHGRGGQPLSPLRRAVDPTSQRFRSRITTWCGFEKLKSAKRS